VGDFQLRRGGVEENQEVGEQNQQKKEGDGGGASLKPGRQKNAPKMESCSEKAGLWIGCRWRKKERGARREKERLAVRVLGEKGGVVA